MRFLSLALFAEGPSDHVFLQRVLYRLTHEKAFKISDSAVEIPEAFVRGDGGRNANSRQERVLSEFGRALNSGSVTLLFLHADGANDPDRERAARVIPCIEHLLANIDPVRFECVAVLPVRETEAWAIADPEALKLELGTRKSSEELGIEIAHGELERLADPKSVLKRAQSIAAGTTRHRMRRSLEGIPSGLGERVDLNLLRRLTAFRALEEDLENALRRLWAIAAN